MLIKENQEARKQNQQALERIIKQNQDAIESGRKAKEDLQAEFNKKMGNFTFLYIRQQKIRYRK
jgi:hypothetical protein